VVETKKDIKSDFNLPLRHGHEFLGLKSVSALPLSALTPRVTVLEAIKKTAEFFDNKYEDSPRPSRARASKGVVRF